MDCTGMIFSVDLWAWRCKGLTLRCTWLAAITLMRYMDMILNMRSRNTSAWYVPTARCIFDVDTAKVRWEARQGASYYDVSTAYI